MKSSRGQSLVELAITFMILMFLLVGTVEFSIIFFQYVQLRDAAQEGALYGSLCPNDTVSIEERIRSSSDSPIDLYSPDVSISVSKIEDGDAVEVHVMYTHKLFLPFVPRLIGRSEIVLDAEVIDTILSETCNG